MTTNPTRSRTEHWSLDTADAVDERMCFEGSYDA